ncbi:MAG: cytosine deaminase [Cyanobacteria bacterium P01_A01_bin.135]
MIPDAEHYCLRSAHVPTAFLDAAVAPTTTDPRATLLGDALALVDIVVAAGTITQILPAGQSPLGLPSVDLSCKLVWPCFVDMHTHLDKGHIWQRCPNPDRTFDGALGAVASDAKRHWDAEDLHHRMSFGLKCSYAHGTHAIRTHLDSQDGQAEISLSVFRQLAEEWSGRLKLQAVCLVPLEYFLGPEGEALADQMAETPGGILGGVSFPNPDLDQQLDRVFAMARERQLDLDFHTDESGDPTHRSLRQIGEAAQRHQFAGQVTCGHCCSLAVQSPKEVTQTINAIKAARIGVVSLPLCNLYLQDRQQQASRNFRQTATPATENLQTGLTPRWRGVTLLHELKQAGVPVAIASDNCRDPFHGFGDHDALEVFNWSVRIAHLDNPYSDWPLAITTTPADLMGLPEHGRLKVGAPADFIVFRARTFSELLPRPQSDRLVVRNGKAIETALPDYAELDSLMV